MDARPFRILSLDSGGIMGAFAASAAATFKRATAEEICRFYETEGPRIFPKRSGVQAWLGRMRDAFRPRFSNKGPTRGHPRGRRGPTAEGRVPPRLLQKYALSPPIRTTARMQSWHQEQAWDLEVLHIK